MVTRTRQARGATNSVAMFRLLLLLALIALPVYAQDLNRVTDRQEFLDQVSGRTMNRLGIGVQVTPDGTITGRAFGSGVTGSWEWQDGFFCREMSWGSRSWDWNCQAVYIGGDTVRFVADRGQGDTADLSLR